jgi:hypothetical protein
MMMDREGRAVPRGLEPLIPAGPKLVAAETKYGARSFNCRAQGRTDGLRAH